jgi:hypothetical protein
MTNSATATNGVRKPKPAGRLVPLPVQVVTRVTDQSRERIKALAEKEGLTIQQLGAYAWSLALQAYGQEPLPEAEA